MKIKKIIGFFLPALMIISFTGCGADSGSPAAENPSVLNVVLLDGNDRFTHMADGQPEGIEPEISSILASDMGVEVNFSFAENREALFKAIQDGTADLAFGRIRDSESVLKNMKTSRSYGKGGIYFVTKKYDYTDSLTLRKSGKVGVMESVGQLLDSVPGIEGFGSSEYTEAEALARDVESGAVTIGICSEREALSLDMDSVQIQEVLDSPMESYVAVMPEDSALVNNVNQAISRYMEENYFSSSVTE